MRGMGNRCVGRQGCCSDWKWKTSEQVDLETGGEAGVDHNRPINRADTEISEVM